MPKNFLYSSEIIFGGRYISVIPEEAFTCRDTVISRVKSKVCVCVDGFLKTHAPMQYQKYTEHFSTSGILPSLFKSDMTVKSTLRSTNFTMQTLMLHYISQEILPRYTTNIDVTTHVVTDHFSGSRGVTYQLSGGQDAFAAIWWLILVDRLLNTSDISPSSLPTVLDLITKSDASNKLTWYNINDQSQHAWMWRNKDIEPEAWKWIYYSDGPYSTSLSGEFIDNAVVRTIENVKVFDLYDLLMEV